MTTSYLATLVSAFLLAILNFWPANTPPLWNSLEIAKLGADFLIPITVAVFGYWINLRLNKLEHRRWTSQKVIEKRLKVYEECAPHVNDLYCYFKRVGGWKEMKPNDIVGIKRKLDRLIHVNAPLFRSTFLDDYRKFIRHFFSTHTGTGEDAKLRTKFDKHRQANQFWELSWEKCYDQANATDEDTVDKAHERFKRAFSEALEIET